MLPSIPKRRVDLGKREKVGEFTASCCYVDGMKLHDRYAIKTSDELKLESTC